MNPITSHPLLPSSEAPLPAPEEMPFYAKDHRPGVLHAAIFSVFMVSAVLGLQYFILLLGLSATLASVLFLGLSASMIIVGVYLYRTFRRRRHRAFDQRVRAELRRM